MCAKRVVHLGPIGSQGGMSSVIEILLKNSPDGWESDVICTFSNKSLFGKIFAWRNAQYKLNYLIKNKKIDIAHIHVTHSISWFRKVSFMKNCRKNNIPIIVHIHSGRFDDFCNRYFGFLGAYVKRCLNHKNTKVILLEHRWKKILKKWVPPNSEVINNSADVEIKKKDYDENDCLNILMLARGDKIKGHLFAIEILEYLIAKGNNVKMDMTGMKKPKKYLNKSINFNEWISDENRNKLISNSDFLILPSEFEGSSMSVIESIVNELPCLASNSSSETIGIDELILPLNSPKEWGDKIISLMDKNEYKRIHMKIKEQAVRFDPTVNKKIWGDTYKNLIKND